MQRISLIVNKLAVCVDNEFEAIEAGEYSDISVFLDNDGIPTDRFLQALKLDLPLDDFLFDSPTLRSSGVSTTPVTKSINYPIYLKIKFLMLANKGWRTADLQNGSIQSKQHLIQYNHKRQSDDNDHKYNPSIEDALQQNQSSGAQFQAAVNMTRKRNKGFNYNINKNSSDKTEKFKEKIQVIQLLIYGFIQPLAIF
jgi:hypothetical protein